MIAKAILLLSLAVRASCEALYDVPHAPNYSHGTMIFSNLSVSLDTNRGSPNTDIRTPFPLYIHHTIYNGGDVCMAVASRSSVLFELRDGGTFSVNISYEEGNIMTGLEMWDTSTNFTVHYVGRSSNNSLIEWRLTLFSDGSSSFLLDIPNDSLRTVTLLSSNKTYQTIDKSGAVLYKTCAISCFDCLKTCSNSADCEKNCPQCYQAGGGNCVSIVALYYFAVASVSLLVSHEMLYCLYH